MYQTYFAGDHEGDAGAVWRDAVQQVLLSNGQQQLRVPLLLFATLFRVWEEEVTVRNN